MGRRGSSQPILNLDAAENRMVNNKPLPLYYLERTPVPTKQEAGWALERCDDDFNIT
jgi:hypothetical protein